MGKVRMKAKDRPVLRLKKKRGGQPGNRNRRIHGDYSLETRLRRAQIRLLLARCKAAIALVPGG